MIIFSQGIRIILLIIGAIIFILLEIYINYTFLRLSHIKIMNTFFLILVKNFRMEFSILIVIRL